MRCLLFEKYVIVEWGNIIIGNVVCHEDTYIARCSVYSRHTVRSRGRMLSNAHGIRTPRVLKYALNPGYP
jgi:hypothetical protein